MLKIIVLRFFSLCQSSKACYIVLINIFLYYLTSQVVRVVKNLPANAGDAKAVGSIPGWGWSPGVGNSNPLWYYCLENSIDRGTWWATVHGVTKNQTRLSMCGVDTWIFSFFPQFSTGAIGYTLLFSSLFPYLSLSYAARTAMSKEFSLSPLHISYQGQGICFLIGWIKMKLGIHNFRRCCCLVLLVTKRAHVLSWIVTPPKFICTGAYIYITLFGNEIFLDVSESNEAVLINSESVSHSTESKSLGPHEL